MNNHVIRRVDSVTHEITTVAGAGTAGYSGDDDLAIAAELNFPQSVAVDTLGNFLIADFENHRVRRVEVDSKIITTVAGTGVAGFSGDNGPAIDAQLELSRQPLAP